MKYLFLLLLIINTVFADDTKINIDKEKIYKIGIVKNWGPYYIVDNKNKPTGYAIELFEKIANNLNLKYKYIYADNWEELLGLVEKGKIDIIPNVGVALNRSKYLNFTQTTDVFEIGLYKNKNLLKIDDIKNKKIGVVEKNVCVKLIDSDIYKNRIVFTSFYNSLNSLNNNEISVLCYPKHLIDYSIKELNLKNIQPFGEPIKIVNRAVGIIKSDTTLLNDFNKVILKLKASGEYQKIYNKWFMKYKDIEINYEELLLIILLLTAIFFIFIYYIKSKEWILTQNELKEKMEEVDNLHKRLFLAADKALAGYWEWNIETNYLYLSKGWKEYLGYRDDELENSFITFKNTLHPDDFESTMNTANHYTKNINGIYKAKFRLKHKNGQYKWTSAIGAISPENKNIFFGFHVDIDDLITTKETLIAQSKSAIMGEMIGLIAHQFKQPLSVMSIISSNELVSIDLDEKITNKMIQENANQILHQVEYLSETIDTFRDFLKPSKENKEVNINNIINRSLKIVEKSLRNNNIEIEKELAIIPDIILNGSEFMQVIINLINNSKDAFKNSNLQEKKILLKTYQNINNIVFEIIDNAGGIPNDKIKNVFDAYFTTKIDDGGTGLGLYIVKTIIEEHCNGSIKVENRNDGVTFTIVLPFSNKI